MVKGADNARAQGQAIIKTAVNTFTATDIPLLKYQYVAAIIPRARMKNVKYLEILSVSDLKLLSSNLLNTS